jgi:hypothetical protein
LDQSTQELRLAWRKLHRAEPPLGMSRDLLIRSLAYELEQRAHGSPNLALRRRLLIFAVASERGALLVDPGVVLKAASKKKGMWMGGIPPLGYRAQDGKLLVIENEAEIVRAIFCRYAALGSVRLLKDELEARGIKTKSWTTASGRRIGGKPFSRGALYLMLQNRLYRGEIVHKGQSHPNEHTPIIDQPL